MAVKEQVGGRRGGGEGREEGGGGGERREEGGGARGSPWCRYVLTRDRSKAAVSPSLPQHPNVSEKPESFGRSDATRDTAW